MRRTLAGINSLSCSVVQRTGLFIDTTQTLHYRLSYFYSSRIQRIASSK